MSARKDDSASPYLFISYASIDRVRVQPIVEALHARGIRIWMDHSEIPGGTHYGTEISDGIRNCTALALMCSPAALASRNVKQEIMLAWKHQRPYLPILLEPTVFPADIEYWLEGLQWIEVFDRHDDDWLPRVLRAYERIHPSAVSHSALPTSALASTSAPPEPPAAVVPLPPARRTNLPAAPPLIGRESELAEVTSHVRDAHGRLVTLTGPGGTGKSRLALQAAVELAEDFAEVVFVPLASIPEAGFVVPTIAEAINIKESGGADLVDQLIAALDTRHMLLILDNFEHVLDAAADIDRLLQACPALHVLATSRSRLGLYGEQEMPVAPLRVPDTRHLPPLTELEQVAAVSLFLARARALRPNFMLTETNAAAIADICVRLDGLPLAIELAAARIKLLTPEAMVARMSRALPLLTGGARNLPARQQTLRDAIAWSWDLLTVDEQKLYRRLSGFRGGFTIDAAEAVAGTPESGEVSIDVFAGLERLVEHSLVHQIEQPSGDVRFTMLETIREFGLDQLEVSGESNEARDRHAKYFLDLADQAHPELLRARQVFWLEQLEVEHDNLRVALEWYLESRDFDAFARIAGALWRFWLRRGHLAEGHRWLKIALQERDLLSQFTLARALHGGGALAWAEGDIERSIPLLEECVDMLQEIGETHQALLARNSLGVVLSSAGEYQRARSVHLESLEISRDVGDEYIYASALGSLAEVCYYQGNPDEASGYWEQSLEAYRKVGDSHSIAVNLHNLGDLSYQLGNLDRATTLLEESLTLFRELGDSRSVATTLNILGLIACTREDYAEGRSLLNASLDLYTDLGDKRGAAQVISDLALLSRNAGDEPTARQLYTNALQTFQQSGDKRSIAECLAGIAGLAALGDNTNSNRWAARILGASEALLESITAILDVAERTAFERDMASVRAKLGEEAFAAAHSEGRTMTLEHAISEALTGKLPTI